MSKPTVSDGFQVSADPEWHLSVARSCANDLAVHWMKAQPVSHLGYLWKNHRSSILGEFLQFAEDAIRSNLADTWWREDQDISVSCAECGTGCVVDYWQDIHPVIDKPWFVLCGMCGDTGLASVQTNRAPTNGKAPIPTHLRWQIWERDDFTCRGCGTRQRLTIDHITPESAGGTLDPDNLQTLCKSCNSAKGTKSPEEWEEFLNREDS